MALGAEPHGQHVVGEMGGLVPGGRQGDVQADPLRVGEHLDPGEAVRIGPDRVVHAREVDIEEIAAPLQEMREEEGHLHQRKRILGGPGEFVPVLRMPRQMDGTRHELVPRVGMGAALGSHRAHQCVEKEEGAGHLPAAEVARRRAAPVVGREPGAGPGHEAGHRPRSCPPPPRTRAPRTRTCTRRTSPRASPRIARSRAEDRGAPGP